MAGIVVGAAGGCVEALEPGALEGRATVVDCDACGTSDEVVFVDVVGTAIIDVDTASDDVVVDVVAAGLDDSVDDVDDAEADMVDDSGDNVVERLPTLPCTN